MKRSKDVPVGVVFGRVEMIVDGGRMVNDQGMPEVDLVWATDAQARATITIPDFVLSGLPIGARVVVQLERLPTAPKVTSKTSTKKRRSQ